MFSVRWDRHLYIIVLPTWTSHESESVQAVSCRNLPQRFVFSSGSVHVRFVEDKVTRGQALPEHSRFPLIVSFQKLFKNSGTSGPESLFLLFFLLFQGVQE